MQHNDMFVGKRTPHFQAKPLGWNKALHYELDLSFGISSISCMNKLRQRHLLMWICFLFFICVTQLYMLASTHEMQTKKMMSIRNYLQTHTGKLEDLFEKHVELFRDADVRNMQEYIKDDKDNLIPHENEWVYVSSHSKDMYSYSKPVKLPVKRFDFDHTKKINCKVDRKHDFRDLIVCNSKIINPFIVVSATMHNSRQDKMFIFKNSINMWSDFNPRDVLPVMYISSVEEFRNNSYILKYACSKGWMVLLTPKCNKHGIPVLNTMVQTLVQKFPKAQWHGYVNGDMLFDQSLVSTLKFLTSSNKYIPISMAVGRRYTIPIPQDFEIKNHLHFQKMFLNGQPSLDESSLADYFFTQKGRYDWRRVPPFVIGRILFDSWLLHDAISTNKKIVDITESIRAGHQYNTDQSQYMNGHESAPTDANYNADLIHNLNISFNLSICYTSCTSLKTLLVDQASVRETNRTIKYQSQWISRNMAEAWSETDTLNKIGDPFFPRVHTIPQNTSVYVEAIARRYGIYEEDDIWKRKRELFERYPTLGIKPDKSRFRKICRNHGANTRRQLTLLNVVNKVPATEWKLWFRK